MPTPVDGCNTSFRDLAASVLPDHFSRLEESIKSPFPAKWVREPGIGEVKLLKRIQRQLDFPGCYVFIENTHPLYVGISRGVIGRLYQHLTANNHFSGSLAYFIAKCQYDPGGTREHNMTDAGFRTLFEDSQIRLEQCSIATVEIGNPVELHLFEVYAAMELQTGEFNTFRTH